ncbi:hypothetical protein EXIGLDRAFT_828855 [Exidia glandulosa HHB12029]|uniref:F-box domain-containing protein n=1 Tax=Exidia glandulosa HHB12029 TaxID=1314781 RepID=A0A165Q5K8_EXIGL|nr:hypothetical protein EXIGLDRAFT_828855 [Exidia glandulosa HHB12029]
MARVSIADLPDELLCDIFVYLAFAGRVTSTHVCRRWRAAALDAPGQLWNEITSSARRLGVLEQVLARSATAPVSLMLLITDVNVTEVTTALALHLGHCKALRLQFIDDIEDEPARDLAQAMSAAAPILERFALQDRSGCLARGFSRDMSSLFAAQAPRLIAFQHHGRISHLNNIPALRHVQHFVHLPREPIVEDDIIAAMKISPVLLDVACEYKFCAFDLSSQAMISFPPNIRSVTILAATGASSRLLVLLRRLDFSGLQHVTITCRMPFLTEQETNEMILHILDNLSLAPRTMEMDTTPDGSLAIFAVRGRDGRVLEINHVPPSLQPSIVPYIAVLEIIETAWNAIVHWPPAPVLKELRISLVAPALYEPEFDVGMFVEVRRDRVLHCPALQTLALSTRQPGDPALRGFSMSFPPESLLLLVQHQLRTGMERIPLLQLCGLELLAHEIDVLAKALDLFDDVQLAPGHRGKEFTPIERLLDM